jgi:hypothetical protein
MYSRKHRRRTLKRHSRSRKTVGGFSLFTPFFQAFSAFRNWRTSRSKKNGHPAHHPVHHFKPKSKKVKEEMGRMTKIITETPEYQSALNHEEKIKEEQRANVARQGYAYNRLIQKDKNNKNNNRNRSPPVLVITAEPEKYNGNSPKKNHNGNKNKK